MLDINDDAVIERLAQHLYVGYVRRQNMTPVWEEQDDIVKELWRRDAREALEVALGA